MLNDMKRILIFLFLVLFVSCSVEKEFIMIHFTYNNVRNTRSIFEHSEYKTKVKSLYKLKIPKGYISINDVTDFEDPINIKVLYSYGEYLYITSVISPRQTDNFENIGQLLRDSLLNNTDIVSINYCLGTLVKQNADKSLILWPIDNYIDISGLDKDSLCWREIIINKEVVLGYKNVSFDKKMIFDISLNSIKEQSKIVGNVWH